MMTVTQLAEACQLGNKNACRALSMTILCASHFTFADAEEDTDHPNRMPFKGVLLLLDQASTKPPHGSRGHRILVPLSAAKKHLSGIVGMGVNYDPGNLDEHMPRHKVGVITDAWIEGNKAWVSGFVYKKDFPEAEKQLKGRKDLGMSMELANVYVEDENADVWRLLQFDFTGATILKKDAAAYYGTSLSAKAVLQKIPSAAAAAAKGEGETMDKDQKKKKKVAIAAAGTGISTDQLATVIARAVRAGNQELVAAINASTEKQDSLAEKVDELAGVVIQGSADVSDEEDVDLEAASDDEEDMDAAKSEDDEDDDMDAAKSKDDGDDDEDEDDDSEDDDDDDELDAMEDLEDKAPYRDPGEVNKGAKNKGRKTSTTDVGAEAAGGKPFPNLVKGGKGMKGSASLQAAATTIRGLQRKLSIQASAHKKQIKKLNNKLERMDSQLQAAADQTTRRSAIPSDLTNLAAKSNIDLRELQASGQKMTVEQVDTMIAASGMDVEPHQKMAWKNRLLEQGLMEEGRIERTFLN